MAVYIVYVIESFISLNFPPKFELVENEVIKLPVVWIWWATLTTDHRVWVGGVPSRTRSQTHSTGIPLYLQTVSPTRSRTETTNKYCKMWTKSPRRTWLQWFQSSKYWFEWNELRDDIPPPPPSKQTWSKITKKMLLNVRFLKSYLSFDNLLKTLIIFPPKKKNVLSNAKKAQKTKSIKN